MKRYRRGLLLFIALFIFPLISGCGKKSVGEQIAEKEQEENEQETEITEDSQLYILLYSNMDTGHVFLENIETGRQEEFSYHGGTYIRNRYGDSITISQLQIGELVEVSYTEKKELTELRVAADTFVYDDVSNYKIASENDMITILDSKYYYNEKLKIFSDSGIISMNELSQSDVLCFRGIEKQVLSITVKQGHGMVALRNTKDFEGGMITIGNVAAQEITSDMVLEIPEGTYQLSVAHDGYGGSREITVERFEELVIDLNTLRGEGPGYCRLQITVVPENTKVTLNGAETDCSQPMEIKYGSYRLTAEADGYVTYSGTLVANSPEAAITIELQSEEEAEKEKEEEDSKKDESEKEDDKKDESKKEDDKKDESKKEDDKKDESKKEDDKKDESKKEDDKKDESKKEDDKKDESKEEDSKKESAGGKDSKK